MRRFLFAVFLFVSCATGAVAGPIEEAISAYERGDYTLAARLLRPLAEQGQAVAQSSLGWMYEHGQGVPQDAQEAVQWYRKAAEQEIAVAQTRLGMMYHEGQGVLQDYKEALKWCRKAAEQGDVSAQGMLGQMYEKGQGVPQNDQESVKWIRLAAEQGEAMQQDKLGLRYEFGIGVPQDFVRAYMWFNVAAAAWSGDLRKTAMKNRYVVASQMTAEQIGKAQEMARRRQKTKFKDCD